MRNPFRALAQRRRERERERSQVRFQKHVQVQPGEWGDIEFNRRRADELRRQAQKGDG